MKVKMVLPALTEAKSPYFRPIKYSPFPPLGLATLAAYLRDDDQVNVQDEHVETLDLDDQPDLVVIQVYITSAYRAYQLADHYRAKGAHVALGGLHVTSLPHEAVAHADTIFLGPGEDNWPVFLDDFRARRPGTIYRSTLRSLSFFRGASHKETLAGKLRHVAYARAAGRSSSQCGTWSFAPTVPAPCSRCWRKY